MADRDGDAAIVTELVDLLFVASVVREAWVAKANAVTGTWHRHIVCVDVYDVIVHTSLVMSEPDILSQVGTVVVYGHVDNTVSTTVPLQTTVTFNPLEQS